jgi:hypothetical protein
MPETKLRDLRSYRQGDVLLVPCADIPVGACEEAVENGRVVLARGERTGHAHTMAADRVCYFRGSGSGSGGSIRVAGPAPVDLTHQEHMRLAIPPGNYRVVQQREYQPRATPRTITD